MLIDLLGGGINWTGGTVCASGFSCVAQNPYYSQCLASSGSGGSSPTSSVSSVAAVTTSSVVHLSATTPVSTAAAVVSTTSTSPAQPTKSVDSSGGATYKASFTHYGAGDTFGSPNCNTNTAACGWYTYPGYSAAA